METTERVEPRACARCGRMFAATGTDRYCSATCRKGLVRSGEKERAIRGKQRGHGFGRRR